MTEAKSQDIDPKSVRHRQSQSKINSVVQGSIRSLLSAFPNRTEINKIDFPEAETRCYATKAEEAKVVATISRPKCLYTRPAEESLVTKPWPKISSKPRWW